MTTSNKIPFLVASFLFTLFACGGHPSGYDDELAGALEDDLAKADGVARPIGTFRRALPAGRGGFALLTLKTDRTHHYSQELVNCTPGACTDALSGKFRFVTSHGKRYVVLYHPDGDLWSSFEYRLTGDTLSLRYAGRGGSFSWFTMKRTADRAWCDAAADCALQNLPSPGNPRPAWACRQSTCVY
jgi:hypothetical protein